MKITLNHADFVNGAYRVQGWAGEVSAADAEILIAKGSATALAGAPKAKAKRGRPKKKTVAEQLED